jgi:hypothetical protein
MPVYATVKCTRLQVLAPSTPAHAERPPEGCLSRGKHLAVSVCKAAGVTQGPSHAATPGGSSSSSSSGSGSDGMVV